LRPWHPGNPDKGLGAPQQEPACLKCHATKASLGEGVVIDEKANYADNEGVGCEACHGPGSDYKSKNVMLDPEAARAAGLIMNMGCRKCHNEESPTFKGFDYEARWTSHTRYQLKPMGKARKARRWTTPAACRKS
jgi:hypothetical protein